MDPTPVTSRRIYILLHTSATPETLSRRLHEWTGVRPTVETGATGPRVWANLPFAEFVAYPCGGFDNEPGIDFSEFHWIVSVKAFSSAINLSSYPALHNAYFSFLAEALARDLRGLSAVSPNLQTITHRYDHRDG